MFKPSVSCGDLLLCAVRISDIPHRSLSLLMHPSMIEYQNDFSAEQKPEMRPISNCMYLEKASPRIF